MNENKTRKQLLDELAALRQRVTDMDVLEVECKRLEHVLGERVKELWCLYSISRIAENPGITLDELYQEVVNLLPLVWQYPAITCAQITINGKRFEAGNYRKSKWRQSSDIKVNGAKAGVVEVCYSEEKPELDEGPFLKEERLLIESVGGRLGRLTERERAKKAARASEERLRSLINSMEDLVFVISLDGTFKNHIQSWDREDLYISPGEFIGKKIKDVLPPDPAELLQSAMKVVLTSGETQQFDYYIIIKGRKLWYDARVSPIKDLSGAVSEFLAVVRNITHRKHLEESRAEQAAALARTEEVEQSRMRIIATQESLRKDIAQEIHGSVQNRFIVMMHRLNELERSDSSKQRAARIVDLRQEMEEILEKYIRPISHRLFPAILRRGLIPALKSLADQFENVQSIDMKLSREFERQERINPRFITGHVKLAVYRIFEEAIINATKHAKASRITVKLELSSNGWLRLVVRDDGGGFDMKNASAANLGTLMMQDYAEIVNGYCVINSTPGKGTKVTLTVPLTESEAAHPEKTQIPG